MPIIQAYRTHATYRYFDAVADMLVTSTVDILRYGPCNEQEIKAYIRNNYGLSRVEVVTIHTQPEELQ